MIIVALITLYFRAVKPIMEFVYPNSGASNSDFVDYELDEFDDQSFSDDGDAYGSQVNHFSNTGASTTQVDFNNLRWNENIVRDPFRKLTQTPKISASRQIFSNTSSKPKTRLPSVSAIVLAEKLKFAVIDGEIFQEGDTFKGYQIRRISEKEISLLDESKNTWHKVFVSE